MAGEKIEGIILAAGKGTRMAPLTDLMPKPLLPVTGVPILEIAAEKLLRSGASRLHINLFHLGGMIREYTAGKGWPVVFHEEEELLDTGGGIGNMVDDLAGADHILLHNGDIISSIGFEDALDAQHLLDLVLHGQLVLEIEGRMGADGQLPVFLVRHHGCTHLHALLCILLQ